MKNMDSFTVFYMTSNMHINRGGYRVLLQLLEQQSDF